MVNLNLEEEGRVIELTCMIRKPEPSPITTSFGPSYFEWIDKLARSDVMSWEAVESTSYFLSLELLVVAQCTNFSPKTK